MDEIFPKALDTCQSSFLSWYSGYELIVYDTVTSRVVRKHINLVSLTSQTRRFPGGLVFIPGGMCARTSYVAP